MMLCVAFSLYSDTSPTLDLATLSMMKTANGEKIKIIETVAPRWQELGAQMKFDKVGTKLDIIKAKHNDPKDCSREMFQYWLRGSGVRPCSWKKLIELLQECDFELLADQVREAVH